MGLSEYQRAPIDAEFRSELHNAFMAGFWYCLSAATTRKWDEPSFAEWFEKSYGDILDSGDISPEDEKTVWEDENGPLY
jgi:hypothetical protein